MEFYMKKLKLTVLVSCLIVTGSASAAVVFVGDSPAQALDGTWVSAPGTDVPIAFSLKDPATVTAAQLVVSPSSIDKPSQIVAGALIGNITFISSQEIQGISNSGMYNSVGNGSSSFTYKVCYQTMMQPSEVCSSVGNNFFTTDGSSKTETLMLKVDTVNGQLTAGHYTGTATFTVYTL